MSTCLSAGECFSKLNSCRFKLEVCEMLGFIFLFPTVAPVKAKKQKKTKKSQGIFPEGNDIDQGTYIMSHVT